MTECLNVPATGEGVGAAVGRLRAELDGAEVLAQLGGSVRHPLMPAWGR